jgi:hypothetical protein
VWEPTDARFGVMTGERLLVGSPTATWTCFDIAHDPPEKKPLPAERCGAMLDVARREFAGADVRR